ncbi:MAG: hypothetical protein JHC31_01940 [Sulfurihydrogenibium sp.]|nr:hypothetical protein [Sulfurihydrogenibium sp.]
MYLFIFFLLCIGMIFIDLPIYERTVTHSLVIFFTPLIFAFILVVKNFKVLLTKNIKLFIQYIIVSFTISLILLYYLVLTKGEFYAYNKNLLIKHFEAFISLSLLHFLVYFLLVLVCYNLSPNLLRNFVFLIFLFLTLVGFIEYLDPEKLSMFHSTSKDYERLRLFTAEPSQAVLLYLIFSSLSLFFIENVFLKIFISILSGIIFILINSKGGFITLFFISVILFLKKIKNIKSTVILLLILVIASYLFVKFAFPSLYIDINNFSSFSTRFSSLISAILILFKYPLGLGYGSYIFYYPKILEQSYEIANALFINLFGIPLSYTEISDMISTGENIGVKAGIPQSVMLNGWVAVIFWLVILRSSLKYIKKININTSKKIVLEFLILYIFIQLLIGSEYTLLYAIWLPIALIEVMYYKQQEVICNET